MLKHKRYLYLRPNRYSRKLLVRGRRSIGSGRPSFLLSVGSGCFGRPVPAATFTRGGQFGELRVGWGLGLGGIRLLAIAKLEQGVQDCIRRADNLSPPIDLDISGRSV